MSEWMLCEQCHYSWLRDPTRAVPTQCPECRSPVSTPIKWGAAPEDVDPNEDGIGYA